MKNSFDVHGEVLCGNIYLFFWIWRPWLLNEDHGVFGNLQKLVEARFFVSQQRVLDIHFSCHLMGILICHFIDRYPNRGGGG